MSATSEPMELKDFIKKSLVQIIEGVQDARAAVQGGAAAAHLAEVSPTLSSSLSGLGSTVSGSNVEMISFDVAVVVVEGEAERGGADAKIGVFGFSAGVGGKLEAEKKTTNTSRISFRVPIALPQSGKRASDFYRPIDYRKLPSPPA